VCPHILPLLPQYLPAGAREKREKIKEAKMSIIILIYTVIALSGVAVYKILDFLF